MVHRYDAPAWQVASKATGGTAAAAIDPRNRLT